MTLPLARELARHRMRVNTIAPGIFETPILASLTEQARSSIASQVPYPQRLGRASEFAALAEHLLRNEMINGEVVRIDGALRLGPS
jgi:NAD(P)-dependent dehydrogenase (short-subunit alcohol dehydrogenase family)